MTLNLKNRINVDFGYVPLLNTLTQIVRVPSPFKIDKIEPCVKTNPFELMFYICKWINRTNGVHKVFVTYKPAFVYRKFYGYFNIIFDSGEITVLCAQGESKGPKVICRKKKMFFYCNNKKPKSVCMTDLVNISCEPAEFNFDLCPNYTELSVTPIVGIVKANEVCSVRFTFVPKHYGFYYKRLYCLFKYQPPLVFDIYAVRSNNEDKIEIEKHVYFSQTLPTYSNNYECYLNDVSKRKAPGSIPLMEIIPRYIDFGLTQIGTINSYEFTVKSNSLSILKISWVNDNDNIFSILPNYEILHPNETKTFSAMFQPKWIDQYYSKEMDGLILWGENSEFIVPFPLSVNLIGSSFESGKCFWEPFYCLEEKKIIMPSTAPNIPTYASFNIYRTGHLPIQFKFVPPEHTMFCVKPLQGLITNKFQIILIQLFPGLQANIGYVETWHLYINITDKIGIQICGSAELPSLIFENKGQIDFPMMHVDCICTRIVTVRNCTRLPIVLTFKHQFEKNLVSSKDHFYYLSPNQQIEPILQFYPPGIGPHNTTLIAELLYEGNDGSAIENNIVLAVTAFYGRAELDCIPPKLSFGDCLYSEWTYQKFYVNNHSFYQAFVKLFCEPSTIDCEVGESTITPDCFILHARQTQEVTLGIRPNSVQLHYLKVVYVFTKNEDFQVELDADKKVLLNIVLNCTYPSLFIDDLRIEDEKVNFSKYFFWEMFQINRINEELNCTKNMQTCKVINLKIPENELGSSPLKLQFLFTNYSKTVVDLKLNLVKDCSCPIVPFPGYGMSCWEPKCNHTNEFVMNYTEKRFEINEKHVLELIIRYESTDKSKFCFDIKLFAAQNPSVQRYLRLFMLRNCYATVFSSIDIIHPNQQIPVILDPVYCGDSNNTLQAIWLYNNCGQDVSYRVQLIDGPKEVFHCVNPADFVPASSMHPILIRFVPYELKLFKITMEIYVGKRCFSLKLQGSGSVNYCVTTSGMQKSVPLTSQFEDNIGLVHVSLEHILFEPMAIHSRENKVFFMKNNSDDLIFYHWRRKHLGGLYNIKIMPELGLLKPQELQIFTVHLKSYSLSVRITDVINCVIINYSTIEKYIGQRKMLSRVQRFVDQFFINSDRFHSAELIESTPSIRELPTLIKIGISFHTYDERKLNIGLQKNRKTLRPMAIGNAVRDSLVTLNKEEVSLASKVFQKIFWDVLKSQCFKDFMSQPRKQIYYISMYTHKMKTVLPYNQIIESMLTHYIKEVLFEIFLFYKEPDNELLQYVRSVACLEQCCIKEEVSYLNNMYYKNILNQGIFSLESHLAHFEEKFPSVYAEQKYDSKVSRVSLYSKSVFPKYLC